VASKEGWKGWFVFCSWMEEVDLFMKGRIWKRSNIKERYFRLENGLLSYFKNEGGLVPLGQVELHSIVALRQSEDSTAPPFALDLVTPDRVYTVAVPAGPDTEGGPISCCTVSLKNTHSMVRSRLQGE
jgi:hypothetical protein